MRLQSVLARLQAAGRKVPNVPSAYPLSEPTFGGGVTETDIVALELALKTKLPADFVLFQNLCGSIDAMDIWNGYSLMTASHIRSLIANPTQTAANISLNSNMLPIGGDGGGNTFFMDITGNDTIWKCEHETGTREQIANTFTDFLELMLADWEHFIAQDDEWNYISG